MENITFWAQRICYFKNRAYLETFLEKGAINSSEFGANISTK